jgi:hypothetical protein
MLAIASAFRRKGDSMEKHNDIGEQPQPLGDEAATTASTEVRTDKQPKSKPTKKTGNRFLTDDEFAAKAKEFEQIHRDFVVQAGMLLDEVRKRTKRGKWGQFCEEIRISRRNANGYIFVARSPLAEKLQGLGIAKALLLARHEEKAKALLKTKAVSTMSVKELEARLRTPKKKTGAVVPDVKTKAYRDGFADGQNTDALRAWAAGVLFVRPEALATPDFIKIARENHAAFRQLFGAEYHETLDAAISTLEQGTTRMAAAA